MPTVLEDVAAIERQREARRQQSPWIPVAAAAERLGLDVETTEALCRQRKISVVGRSVYSPHIDQLAAALASERGAAATAKPTPAPRPSPPAALPVAAAAPAPSPAKPPAPTKTTAQLERERGEAIVANLANLGVIRRPAQAKTAATKGESAEAQRILAAHRMVGARTLSTN